MWCLCALFLPVLFWSRKPKQNMCETFSFAIAQYCSQISPRIKLLWETICLLWLRNGIFEALCRKLSSVLSIRGPVAKWLWHISISARVAFSRFSHQCLFSHVELDGGVIARQHFVRHLWNHPGDTFPLVSPPPDHMFSCRLRREEQNEEEVKVSGKQIYLI